MKMVKIVKGQKLAAPFDGLRIDLDADDIKELATATWVELGGSIACECIVGKIIDECEEYLRRRNDET